jgi:catechol 2,3-dioxygenase-like lactoylglutathione lyase family enzyme
MARITGLLETALYVEDLARSREFYRGLLQFPVMLDTPRLVALDAGGNGVLLLFKAGESGQDIPTRGGVVPGHGGSGILHLAFAIPAEDYAAWSARLADAGIPIRSEVRWPAGGTSLYFDDPDGHVVELATPGLWPNY